MIRSGFGPSPAKAAKMRLNTPSRLQRMKRLYNVLCGPWPFEMRDGNLFAKQPRLVAINSKIRALAA